MDYLPNFRTSRFSISRVQTQFPFKSNGNPWLHTPYHALQPNVRIRNLYSYFRILIQRARFLSHNSLFA